MSDGKETILCITSYEKGKAFLSEAARLGCNVLLLTVEKLKDASWPREALADLMTMPEGLTPEQVLNTVTYRARHQRIDRIVALDEFELESAALIREHMRLPGMGQSTTRFFRDKLAMRQRAQRAGVLVPEFTPILNYDDLREFMQSVPGPWLLKPRSSASAIGIQKIHQPQHLWPLLDELGDKQSHYVGGAYIADVIEHSTGINLWREWAKIEVASMSGSEYDLPRVNSLYAGSVLCLAKMAEPDLSPFDAPEVVETLKRHHHAGLIVASESAERVNTLLQQYAPEFLERFCATAPVPDRPIG
ncbi:acetyl-CoA carboxylase biotin carboxylase subunit family protein [Terriglobus sp. YAF25]|uniref:ATP-grasp domain-containing protein n=1 Tax=Terriglobus sp. YAF25 TaxID=3233080 RepID=UPI003F9A9ADF